MSGLPCFQHLRGVPSWVCTPSCVTGEEETHVHVLYGCGDAQTPRAWGRKLARVDVGNLPDGGVHVVQVLALHHQDRLGWVKVELWGRDTGSAIRRSARPQRCPQQSPVRLTRCWVIVLCAINT